MSTQPRRSLLGGLDGLRHEPTCAYKGLASYWSAVSGRQVRDLAWTYEEPLREASQVAGMVAFFDERVDGAPRDRQVIAWS